MNTEKHPFEPFLPEGARILFLGSFPPQPHRWCMPFYYPNWINDFWRIMGLIHFGDKDHFTIPGEKRFNEADIRAFCTEHGLAFFDTATEVRRLKDNASDAFLEVVTPTDITALLKRIPHCRTLVTTGQKATEVVAEAFHCPIPPVGSWEKIDSIKFWRMPSTSRAYPMPLEKKAEAYRKLFPPHKKLILWDLDGTLIDTLEDLAAAVNHALELRGLPLHSVADYRKMVGHGVRNLVKQALEASLKETPNLVGGDESAAAGDGQQLRASGLRWLKEIGFSGTVPKNNFVQPKDVQLRNIQEEETPDQVGGDGGVVAGDGSVAAGDGQQLRVSGLRWLKEIGFSGTVPKNNFVQPQGEQRLTDAYIDAALADFKEYYSAHIDVHTRPYPGMQELLTELQARGVKMAVASNKFQEGTEHLIREFFPDIQFVAILGNRPGYPLKPDPEIVREVLARAAGTGVEDQGHKAAGTGAEGQGHKAAGTEAEGQGNKAAGAADIGPEDAIMVGDSPTDMRTAANGGIDAVAVSWGYRTEEELAGNQIAHSIEELRRILCFM